MTEELKEYVGEKVRIFLTNGYLYIVDVDKVTDRFLSGKDKFGEQVHLRTESIESVVHISGGKPNE